MGGILGIDPAFNGMAALRERVLRPWQAPAVGDDELRAHEIDSRHGFGHRVLDLEPGVHLEKVELSVLALALDEELNRAGVAISSGTRRGDRRVSHAPANVGGNRRRGTLLDDFLVPPLHRALTLEEVDDIAVGVREDLNLDVPRPFDQPFDIERAVAERRGRLSPRRRDRLQGLAVVPDDAHALAAAARRSLDEHRIAEASRGGEDALVGLIARRIAGHDRDARGLHQRARADLRAHPFHHLCRRTDEDDAGLLARPRQVGALGEESIAGMDGVGLREGGCFHDRLHREIALRRRSGPNAHRPICHAHVQRAGVRVGVDRHALEPRLAAGAGDADRDFAAIGDEDATDHRTHFGFRFSRNARIPSCPSAETRCSAMRSVVTPMTSAGRLPCISLINSLAAAIAEGAEVRISRT